MKEARRGPSTVTRRVVLINHRSNTKEIRRQMEMEILGETMGFTFLTEIGCAYVTRFVGSIPHMPLDFMIHGPPV